MHVNENSIAKILSLKDVNNIPEVRVTMDTSIETSLHVVLDNGAVFKFKECELGLYFYHMANTDEQNSAKTNTKITTYSFLSNLTENK